MPGLRLVIRYVPDSSVSAVREIPVATFNAVIFAFGTSAPVLSATVPAKDPDCANTLGAKHTNPLITSHIALQFFIGRPLESRKRLDATDERAFATPQSYFSPHHPHRKMHQPHEGSRAELNASPEVFNRSFPFALENSPLYAHPARLLRF